MVFIWKGGKKLLGLELTLSNRPGALASVTNIIKENKLDIYYLEILSLSEKEVEFLLVLNMSNHHLPEDKVIEKMKKSESVITIRKSPEFGDIIYPSKYRRFGFEKRRYILFPEANIAGLINGLRERLGEESGKAFLYQIGVGVGIKVYEVYNAPLNITDIEGGVKLITALLRGSGWGDLINYEKGFNELRLRIKDLWECETQRGKTKEPASHYARGILAGYFKSLLGKDVECREEKCIALGDEYCEFVLKW